jgi:hypothetical protein
MTVASDALSCNIANALPWAAPECCTPSFKNACAAPPKDLRVHALQLQSPQYCRAHST